MFILHLIFVLGAHHPSFDRPIVITAEYRSAADCKAASDVIQRAAGKAAILAACTAKG